MSETNFLATTSRQSLAGIDPLLIDFDVLRPLLNEKKDIRRGGEVVAFSPRDICNITVGLIFPEQHFSRFLDEMVYAHDQEEDRRRDDVLRGIQEYRKNYSKRPDILKAFDVLEHLATNYYSFRQKIMERFTPAQATKLDEQFREAFGDPATIVIIGDPTAEWADMAERLFSAAVKALRSLAPKKMKQFLLTNKT